MLRSLFSGVSGVKNQQTYMDVIANNISNINTTGFKSGRITFADTLSQTISGARGSQGNFGGVNPVQIGLGSRISSIDTNFNQGAMESTGMTTDLAINGNGFFVVGDGQQSYYTRAGAFQIDDTGNLLAQGGSHFVQGRMADENGKINSSTNIENIKLPFGQKNPAKATENVSLYCNLDKNASEIEEWLAGNALNLKDGSDVSLSSDLNSIEGIDITNGDAIEIRGTDRSGTDITTVNFEYGTTGTTLEHLINTINTAFNSGSPEGATIELDANGFLRFSANRAGENEMSLTLVPPSSSAGTAQTHTAAAGSEWTVGGLAADGSTDLANIDGANLNNGDTIAVTGTDTDGNPVTVNFVYGTDGTTVSDLLSALNNETSGFSGVTASINASGGIVFTNDSTGTAVSSAITSFTGIGTGVTFDTVAATDDTNVVIPSFTQNTEGSTGTHSTAIVVYDSQGNSHDLVIDFTQDPDPSSNVWTWTATVDNGSITPTSGSSGSVVFNEDGSLKEFKFDGDDTALKFNSAGAKEISIDFGAGTSGSFDGITQYASASTTIAIEQDGYTLGILDNISIDGMGIVHGFYSNGQTKQLAQLALANFTNQGGLQKEGNSLYSANSSSGNPIINWAGINTDTTIVAGHLESSNVDLTQEFSDMILAQRALQANSKVISTSDMILTTVIDRMKRG